MTMLSEAMRYAVLIGWPTDIRGKLRNVANQQSNKNPLNFVENKNNKFKTNAPMA